MINKDDTTYLVNRFFEKCFEFWVNEGRDDKEAFELALKEASEIDRNPFSPMGDLLDPEAHHPLERMDCDQFKNILQE